jgi:hypothetical protein
VDEDLIAVLPAALFRRSMVLRVLLREHGLDLGIDPSFTILDEQRSLDLARESARPSIRQQIRAGNEDVERLAGDFGLEKLVGLNLGWLLVEQPGLPMHNSLRTALKNSAAPPPRSSRSCARVPAVADIQQIGNLRTMLRRERANIRSANAMIPARCSQNSVRSRVSAAQHLSRWPDFMRAVSREKRSMNAVDFDDLLLGPPIC